MRSLSSTVLAEQKKSNYDGLVEAQFVTESTVYNLAKDVIMAVSHTETPSSHNAEIILDNADGDWTANNITGARAQISWGMTTGAGEELSFCAPMWVKSQQNDSVEGHLVTILDLIGIPDMLKLDLADGSYVWPAGDINTVKDILTSILTPGVFSGGEGNANAFYTCPAYSLVFDSEDSLIDSFCPAELFTINDKDSRFDKAMELLRYTNCVMKFGGDDDISSGIYKIHILNPVVSGTVYDYSYSLAAGEHGFFKKSYRTRLTIPNMVWVKSFDGSIVGYAEDDNAPEYSQSRRPVQRIFDMAVSSTAEADSIAAAILQQYQLGAGTGSGEIPMNIGQELYDYVNIVDSRAGDSRAGNVQYINRRFNTLKNTMSMSIGFGSDNYLQNMIAGSLTQYLYQGRWNQIINDPSKWDWYK